MSRILELRQKKGGSFNDSNSLVYVKTHKSAVVGLLDGNDKIDINILPNAILGASKNAGSIDANISLASALSIIAAKNSGQVQLYEGSFLISNGEHDVTASSGHIIQYNDDSGADFATSTTLESGDHLYLVRADSNPYRWKYESSLGQDPAYTFDSLESMYSETISAPNLWAFVAGFKLVDSNVSAYNNAAPADKSEVNLAPGDSATWDNVVEAIIAQQAAVWNTGSGQIGHIVKINMDFGTAYQELVVNDTGGTPQVFVSEVNTHQYVWGVINNTTPLATTTTAGLMSGADKTKLNGLSNYTHPTGGANVNLDGGDIQFVADLTVNNLGHVTAASLGTIRSASTSATGVVELATTTEAQAGTDTVRALTVAAGKALVDRFGSLKQYGLIADTVTTANANHPDEAFALFETGITPA